MKSRFVAVVMFVIMGLLSAQVWAQTPPSSAETALNDCVRQCLADAAQRAPAVYQLMFCSANSTPQFSTAFAAVSTCLNHQPAYPACLQLRTVMLTGQVVRDAVCSASAALPVATTSATPAVTPTTTHHHLVPTPHPATTAAATPRPTPAPADHSSCLRSCEGLTGEDATACRSCCSAGGSQWVRNAGNLAVFSGSTGVRCVRSAFGGQVVRVMSGLADQVHTVQERITTQSEQIATLEGRVAGLQQAPSSRIASTSSIDSELISLRQDRLAIEQAFLDCVMRSRTNSLDRIFHGGIFNGSPNNAEIDRHCREQHPLTGVDRQISERMHEHQAAILAANPSQPHAEAVQPRTFGTPVVAAHAPSEPLADAPVGVGSD